jgi:type IV pilus assembly protein PilN
LIKINLVREGRAVRGAGALPGAAAVGAAAPANVNNIVVVACLIVAAVLALGYWWTETRKRDAVKAQAAAKQSEADKLETIIKDVENYQKRKDNLQKRIDLINQLKQNQKGPVKVMDRISQDLPDLVWLDRMQMSGGVITLNGRGLNPTAIALFVENVKNDPVFEEPNLKQVTQLTTVPLVYGFDMTFHFSYGGKPAEGATGTTGTTSTSGTTGTSGTAATGTGASK